MAESGYELTDKSLTLLSPPAGPFELEVVTALKPQDNSLLEGLYKSSGNYCTQVGCSDGCIVAASLAAVLHGAAATAVCCCCLLLLLCLTS